MLCGHRIQNEQLEQQICITFCIKLEQSSVENIQMIQKAASMGNWGLAASSRQCACSCSCSTSHVEFFGEISNHPGDSTPSSPDLVPCDSWLFPKLKSVLKGERFQTVHEIQKYDETADGNWENRVRSQGAYVERD